MLGKDEIRTSKQEVNKYAKIRKRRGGKKKREENK